MALVGYSKRRSRNLRLSAEVMVYLENCSSGMISLLAQVLLLWDSWSSGGKKSNVLLILETVDAEVSKVVSTGGFTSCVRVVFEQNREGIEEKKVLIECIVFCCRFFELNLDIIFFFL
jgi:hypothetical protein